MDGTGVIVRARGEGEKRWHYGGGLHTWKATTEETNGAFLFFEDHMQQGKVTPIHIHPDADEMFYWSGVEILLRLILSRMSSAVLVQMNGCLRSFQPSMN
jgi:hypothetical protein